MHTTFTIRSYDEGDDSFDCIVSDCFGTQFASTVPAWVMPHLTGMSDDPFELVGNTFKVEFTPAQGA